MDSLEEAKEIMEKIGCNKFFAVYNLELENIAEIRGCNERGESIELEGDICKIKPIIEQSLTLDQEKPIECPINSSMSKYIEFNLKNKSITPCNIDSFECDRIKNIIHPLIEKYNGLFSI